MGKHVSVAVARLTFRRSLTWGVLQERITTTPYGPKATRFNYPIFVNTIQSTFAAISGFIYLTVSTRNLPKRPPVFPTRAIFFPLVLVALTSSLASPFGYASLKHIDYITFILAKSCKLVPVMLLHVSIFRRRYPLYKYAVVAAVTAGVAVFTLHAPTKKKAKVRAEDANRVWGLLLLGINLLFDGLTNSVQDWIFGSFKPYSGPQMMVAMNVISTLVTGSYLVLAPYVAGTSAGQYVGMGSGTELEDAMAFATKYPQVGWDVLGFCACGAIGQVFICKFRISILACLWSEVNRPANLCRFYSRQFRISGSRNNYGNSKDVDHDSFCCLVWAQAHWLAMDWSGIRVQWYCS